MKGDFMIFFCWFCWSKQTCVADKRERENAWVTWKSFFGKLSGLLKPLPICSTNFFFSLTIFFFLCVRGKIQRGRKKRKKKIPKIKRKNRENYEKRETDMGETPRNLMNHLRPCRRKKKKKIKIKIKYM